MLNNEILESAFKGFKTTNGVASNDRFSPQNIGMLCNAIRQMFKLLEIELDLAKLDKIKVFQLDKLNFGCAFFLSSCCEGFVYQNECDTKCKASNYAQINHVDMDYIKKHYSNDFACSNFNNVLINKDIVPEQVGLHLICHEVMHYLASEKTVEQLRKGKDMGDEAINEFFARLATTIFNSIDDSNKTISGYTLWDNEDIFKEESTHTESLGLYGKLMASEQNFFDKKNCPKYNDVNHVKRLAGFYFLNRPMN